MGLDRRAEETIESGGQLGSNGLRGAAFDLVAVNKMNHLAVPQERHRRATGLILAKVLTGAGDGIQVLAVARRCA